MEKNAGRWQQAKLKGLVKDLEATDLSLVICAKNTGSWLTVWGTIVTGTVLAAMEFSDFLCARYDATPPKLQKNTMAALLPYPYVTDRAAALEVLSLHVTETFVTRSSTVIDEPYSLAAYS